MHSENKIRTVRELGGEVWAEAQAIPGVGANWELVNKFVDVVMRVLARHTGAVIENESDLPVAPLPHSGDDLP